MIIARLFRTLWIAVFALAAPFAAHAQLFSTSLAGANEVPAVNSAATGTAFVGIIDGFVVYQVNTQNLNNITLSHIHRGGAGVAGPIVVDFVPTFVNGVAKGAVPITPALAAEIQGNPAGFYVNVHTTANPGGEIRGQLNPSTSVTMNAQLRGANEVPPADPAGTGGATVILGSTMVAYRITTNNLANITLSHIHRGDSTVAGPIIIDFAPTFTNGIAAGIVTTTAQNVADVIANPGGHYVNVHTTAFPAGAARGQLIPAAAAATVQGVPTLAEWALILLASMLLFFGLRFARKR